VRRGRGVGNNAGADIADHAIVTIVTAAGSCVTNA